MKGRKNAKECVNWSERAASDRPVVYIRWKTRVEGKENFARKETARERCSGVDSERLST